MLDYRLKIGLAPMRRDVTPRPGIFNWEKAEARGHHVTEYIKAFEEYQLGYASAVSWFLFAIIFAVTVVNWKLGNKDLTD